MVISLFARCPLFVAFLENDIKQSNQGFFSVKLSNGISNRARTNRLAEINFRS